MGESPLLAWASFIQAVGLILESLSDCSVFGTQTLQYGVTQSGGGGGEAGGLVKGVEGVGHWVKL